MPAPRTRRRYAVTPAAAALSACICGDADSAGGWATSPPVELATDLEELRSFWRSLRPGGKTNALKLDASGQDVLSQIAEATSMALDESLVLVAQLMHNSELVQAVCTFMQQVLEGEIDPMMSAKRPSGIRLSDQLVGLACRLTGDGQIGERFGGAVRPDQGVMPSKEGLVRFPASARENSEGGAAIREAATKGLCRPQFEVHYRPWVDQSELAMFQDMLDTCRVVCGAALFLQRRLQRILMRTQQVAATLAANALTHQTVDLTATYQTFSWGVGREGQLGQGMVGEAARPQCVPALEGKQVVELSCNGNHSFARLEDGSLVSWGGGQCGVSGRHEQEPARTPLGCTVELKLEGHADVQISTGPRHTLVLAGGKIKGWGASWLGQLGNTDMLMNGGCLLTYREADWGNLTKLGPGMAYPQAYIQAIGANQPSRGDPQENGFRHPAVQAQFSAYFVTRAPVATQGGHGHGHKPGGVFTDVVCVAAGGLHSMACTRDGSVWVWGCAEAGTLALDITEEERTQPWVQAMGCGCCDGKDSVVVSVSAPVCVELDDLVTGKAVQVAAGSAISVVRTEAGEVVSWGADGQAPWRVDSAWGGAGEECVASQVAAGGSYALAVVQPAGEVYMWCRHHMMEWQVSEEQRKLFLGTADVPPAWTVHKVPFLSGVERVACGATHAVAATRDGRVLYWPHTATMTAGPSPSQYEMPELAGLRILSIGVGDGFAVVSAHGLQQQLEPDTGAGADEVD